MFIAWVQKRAMVQGIVEYTIEDGKIVTGTFTNDALKGHRFYEILYKRESGIQGTYKATFYDNNGHVTETTLVVNLDPKQEGVYELAWTYDGASQPAYRGRGYMIADNRLTVAYQTV